MGGCGGGGGGGGGGWGSIVCTTELLLGKVSNNDILKVKPTIRIISRIAFFLFIEICVIRSYYNSGTLNKK